MAARLEVKKKKEQNLLARITIEVSRINRNLFDRSLSNFYRRINTILRINTESDFSSLGMSWVTGRMLERSRWSAMLDSVKASVLGLGGAECASLYPDCDLKRERMKRRRRRRRK